jgi:hypothetical protein
MLVLQSSVQCSELVIRVRVCGSGGWRSDVGAPFTMCDTSSAKESHEIYTARETQPRDCVRAQVRSSIAARRATPPPLRRNRRAAAFPPNASWLAAFLSIAASFARTCNCCTAALRRGPCRSCFLRAAHADASPLVHKCDAHATCTRRISSLQVAARGAHWRRRDKRAPPGAPRSRRCGSRRTACCVEARTRKREASAMREALGAMMRCASSERGAATCFRRDAGARLERHMSPPTERARQLPPAEEELARSSRRAAAGRSSASSARATASAITVTEQRAMSQNGASS